MLTLDMLFPDTCLYHLATDVLSRDMLLIDTSSYYVITYHLPLLWYDLSPTIYHVNTWPVIITFTGPILNMARQTLSVSR